MPTIWILTAGRLGDFKQMQAIAEELGWPCEVKCLKFIGTWAPLVVNFPKWLLSIDTPDPFNQGEPDLVLCAEASAAALAVKARRRKRARFRLVCIGRPRGHFADFDLILTSPQYRLTPASNVVELPFPPVPSVATNDAIGRDTVAQRSPLSQGPLTLVLVGGRSPPYQFDSAVGQALGKAIADRLQFTKGSAIVITSPRTGNEIENALRSSLPEGAKRYFWSEGQKANIVDWLHVADEVVVTSDSVSMTVEALQAGKPVLSYGLPETLSFSARLLKYLSQMTLAGPLFRFGLLETRPDRFRLYHLLSEKFALVPFKYDVRIPRRPVPESQIKAAAGAISVLFDKKSVEYQ